jgi:hypothetical protein
MEIRGSLTADAAFKDDVSGLKVTLGDVRQKMREINDTYFNRDALQAENGDSVDVYERYNDTSGTSDQGVNPDTSEHLSLEHEAYQSTTVQFSANCSFRSDHNEPKPISILKGYTNDQLPRVLTWRSNPEQHHRMGNYGKISKYLDESTYHDQSQTIKHTNGSANLSRRRDEYQLSVTPKQGEICKNISCITERCSSHVKRYDQKVSVGSRKSNTGVLLSKDSGSFNRSAKVISDSNQSRGLTRPSESHGGAKLSILVDMNSLDLTGSRLGDIH